MHACKYTESTTMAFPKTVPSFEQPSERDDEGDTVCRLIGEAIKLENLDGCDCRIKKVLTAAKTATRKALYKIIKNTPRGYTDAPDLQLSAITPEMIYKLRVDFVAAAISGLENFRESPKHVRSNNVKPNREPNKSSSEEADESSSGEADESSSKEADEDSDGEEDMGSVIDNIFKGAKTEICQAIHNEQVDRLEKSQQTSGQASGQASGRASSASPSPGPSKFIVHSAPKRAAADAEAKLEFVDVADEEAEFTCQIGT